MAAKKRTTKKATPEPTKNGKAPGPAPKKDICFVIMPFGGWFDTYYKDVYIPAIEAASLEPRRADDLYRPSAIIKDIWEYTQRAKLILADLTGKNPNVFYELGLAHALAKPAILVTETIADVPFDLRPLRVLDYDKNRPDWGVVLSEKITKSISEILAEDPPASVLPVFLSVKAEAKPKAVSEHDKMILELRQDLESLRRELAMRPLEREVHFESPQVPSLDRDLTAFIDRLPLGLNQRAVYESLNNRFPQLPEFVVHSLYDQYQAQQPRFIAHSSRTT